MSLFSKLVEEKTEEYMKSNNQISDETEVELTELKDKVKAAIENGEINDWNQMELVNAYMAFTGPSLNEKKKAKLKVKIIKTPKKVLIGMLNTAIKMSFKD